MNAIKKFNGYVEPYYALLSMLISFGAAFLVIYNFVISPTDLKVVVNNEEVSYPISLSKTLEDTFTNLNENKDDRKYEYISIYDYLTKTTDIKRIVLNNESDKTLKGIKFKHLNSDAITAYTISSDYLIDEEESRLFSSLKYDKDRNIIYLKDLLEIPPKNRITIKLWGSFKKSIIDNDIIISYDGGDAYFEKSYNVSGIKGYFVQYSFEIIFLLILIFIIVYYFGIKNAYKAVSNQVT